MSRIPTGYKQTEVGVVPEDWEVMKMGEITSLMTNGFVGTVKSHYADYDEGVLYIQGYNVEENSFNFHGIKKVTQEFHHQHLKSCLREGDLLTVQTGDVGLTTIVPKELEGANCHALIISRVKRETAFPLFLSLFLNSVQGRTNLKGIETGTTMKHINVGDMVRIPVPVPTLAEQTAIATALSDADALIQALEKLIAKKLAIKQGAMQALLTGKRRLGGFASNGGKFKQTEVGEIPENWDAVPMCEVGESIIGLTYSPKNVREYGTLVLRSSNVQNGKLAFDDNVYVDMDLPSRVVVRKSDILICVRNGSQRLIGKCAIIDESAAGSAFGAFMAVYRTAYSNFIFYQFQSSIIQRQINEVMGATINQITNKDLANFQVVLPKDIEEQTAIATVLSDMDAEIAALETRLAKYKQIKQGMMQNILTGRIRLV
ncbi:MAG: restriction endonuclease subunit S [Acidobacteriota bacterium]